MSFVTAWLTNIRRSPVFIASTSALNCWNRRASSLETGVATLAAAALLVSGRKDFGDRDAAFDRSLTEHSMYQAQVSGLGIDLLSEPWARAESLWMHASQYADTQTLGRLARQAGHVTWIRYRSVRAPGHTCGAVFDPRALRMVTPDMQYEQWHCHTSKDHVSFSNGRQRFDF